MDRQKGVFQMPHLNDPIPNGSHPIVDPDAIKKQDPENLDQEQLKPDEEKTKPEDFEAFNVDKVDQLEREKKDYKDSE